MGGLRAHIADRGGQQTREGTAQRCTGEEERLAQLDFTRTVLSRSADCRMRMPTHKVGQVHSQTGKDASLGGTKKNPVNVQAVLRLNNSLQCGN